MSSIEDLESQSYFTPETMVERTRTHSKVPANISDGADEPPRRGRRRNSSLVREKFKSELLSYGSAPVRSNSSELTLDKTQLIAPKRTATEVKRRQVRMVSPSSQGSTETEDILRTAPTRRTLEPKSILLRPTEKFPEELNPVREGVAPLSGPRLYREGIPPNARWTRISRRLVNPEALVLGNERFEERQGFVIVLRVLTKMEIEQYALKTQEIRGKLLPSM